MKKRLISLFLCSVLLFGMFPTITRAAADSEGITAHSEQEPVDKAEVQELTALGTEKTEATEGVKPEDKKVENPEGKEEGKPEENPEEKKDENPEEKKEEKQETQGEEQTEENRQEPSEEEPACTCGGEDGLHAENCLLYVQPDAAEEKPEGKLPARVEPYSPITGVKPFLKVAPLMNMLSLMTLDDFGGSGSGSGDVVLNKTAEVNTDGSFTITLEAYATGASHTESHYDPADIVLVLDVSNSMRYPMDDSGYEPVYGSTGSGKKDTDGKGGAASDAYSVTDHDSDDFDSNFNTYYVKENDKFVKVFYYGNKHDWGTHDGKTGWTTSTTWNQASLIPKTSANDTNSNHVQFYRIKADSTRFASLKTAVNAFVQNVFDQTVEGGANSIAIVTYASEATVLSDFSSNRSALTSAINNMEMDAKNGTRTDTALAQANALLDGLDSSHDGHNKVVVLFTDGEPAVQTYEEDGVTQKELEKFGTTANDAIKTASEIKGGATLYTIGVFSGASGDISSYDSSVNSSSTEIPKTTNTFLHLVSSNFPDSTSLDSHGSQKEDLNGKSYYLTADSADKLKEIFQEISQEVGGATNTTLGMETVIKDIIAPSFTVPANTSDVKIYTADCTGAGLTFGDRKEVTSGITTTITGDTLDVKGFDFSANWCGDHSGTYSGKKLIIEFTVSPKKGFLGGNGVPTNGETSGMYSGENCIGNFDVPTVNVPIQEIEITASDKNVYLTQVPGEADLKSDVTIKCGNVDITDLSQLDDWQKAYVTIDSSFTNSTGFDATDDGAYTVTASVKPKTEGDSSKPGTVATEQTQTETKNINVFKPELTFVDSSVYYGDTAPTGYDSNLTKTQWKHGDTVSTDSDVTMIGTAPTLTENYTPRDGIVDNEVATKSDIPVEATVSIGDTDVTTHTTFVHGDCSVGDCTWSETELDGDPAFLLHVKTCSLTIEKKGDVDGSDYFVFDITKDGNAYTQATIKGTGSVTITGLPVGTYGVSEDDSTAWRYTSQMENNGSVTLSSTQPSATVTCTNTKNENKWLNDFTRVINIFGSTAGGAIDGN